MLVPTGRFMKLAWSYISGFFDGEGSASMGGNRSRPNCTQYTINFSQSGDEGLLLLGEIRQFFSEEGIKSYIRENKESTRLGKRKVYNLAVAGRPSVELVISKMLPYLRIKKTKCQDIWRYIRAFPPLPKYLCRIRNKQYRDEGRLKWQPKDLPTSEIVADRNKGIPISTIAKKYNVSSWTINSRLRGNVTGGPRRGMESSAWNGMVTN